jgi:DNA modification methylase
MPDCSVDAIVTDPPYGTTDCSWDGAIPFAPMWEQLRRIAKPRAAIALFASQPFTSALVMSNPGMFKYTWVWNKAQSGSFFNAKYQPLRITEDIAVFSDAPARYFPIMRQGKMRMRGSNKNRLENAAGIKPNHVTWSSEYFPTNVLDFPNCANKAERCHPTQKPVALMEYLVRTYTNEGETVLDFTAGSGTTGVACVNTGRHFIGIEREPQYVTVARQRIANAAAQPALVGVA